MMGPRLARLLRRAANRLDPKATTLYVSLDAKKIHQALLRFKREQGLS